MLRFKKARRLLRKLSVVTGSFWIMAWWASCFPSILTPVFYPIGFALGENPATIFIFPEFSGRLRICLLTAANSFFNRCSSLDLRRGTQEEKGKACKAF